MILDHDVPRAAERRAGAGRQPSRLSTRRAATQLTDPDQAIEALRAELDLPGMRAVLLFCSPHYDLVRLGAAIRGAFSCPVMACTTAGQIGPTGYMRGGITGVSLSSEDLTMRPFLIAPLSSAAGEATAAAARIEALVRELPVTQRAFAFLLVDGLALAEERLAASLYQGLGNVPIVGGSAGDDLQFERTAVYWDGQFLSDAAVVALVTTSLPFRAFKLDSFTPTSKRLVVTAADPATRVVREINGRPAAVAYAELLGIERSQLDARAYSVSPMMLRIGNDYYLRAVQRVDPDDSLHFFCSIDEGLVLTLGAGEDPLTSLDRGLREAIAGLDHPALILGCDCILRRLELEKRDLLEEAGRLLAQYHVIGFSTYGEQINAIHVNQTLTGIALGG
jgi:hypothetical protein